MNLDDLRALFAGLTDQERANALAMLRYEFQIAIHPLEVAWNTTAEAILEAIHASPDLTQRGVRGVLAEAIFRTTVVPEQLVRWRSIPFAGDLPYDLLLDDGAGQIKVQVKNQRRQQGEVKLDRRLTKAHGKPVYVVETQRTRNGETSGEDGTTVATRPYRFGEFDVIAVCLQPSTGSWTDFIYCPAHLLLPRPAEPNLLKVMQPVYSDGTHGWTYDFDQAASEVRNRQR
jgi:hypothetical protein